MAPLSSVSKCIIVAGKRQQPNETSDAYFGLSLTSPVGGGAAENSLSVGGGKFQCIQKVL